MQILRKGDNIICIKGREPFTTGEVYKVTFAADRSFHIRADGRPYYGVNDDGGIRINTVDSRNDFELCVPKILHKKKLFQDSEGKIPATKDGDPVGLIKTSTWTWTHRRSALVHVMLLEGCKYIMCEVADEDRDFEWVDSFDIVIITHTTIEDETCNIRFIDINGEEHAAAQPVNLDGSIMSYSQYLKMKK